MIFLSTPFFGKILKDGLLGKIFSPAPLQNAGGCATIGVAKTWRRDPARRDIHIILPIWGKSLYVAALTAYAMGVFCFLTCFSGKRAKAIRILFWRLSLSFFFPAIRRPHWAAFLFAAAVFVRVCRKIREKFV